MDINAMDIHKAIRKHLLDYAKEEIFVQATFAAEYAEIYDRVKDRIFWLRKPKNMKLSCISFFRVSNPNDPLIDKYSPRFQFDVWSSSGKEAAILAKLIEKAFSRFKGTMGGDEGKEIIQGVYDNTQEFYEEDTGIYHMSVDVIFHYLEN